MDIREKVARAIAAVMIEQTHAEATADDETVSHYAPKFMKEADAALAE